MDRDELVVAAAANLAAWHESSVRALGAVPRTGDWWWTAPTPRPWIYFTAIGLRRARDRQERDLACAELRRHLTDPAGAFQAVCDSFAQLDLRGLGLVHRANGLWYARPAGPVGESGDRRLPPERYGGEASVVAVRSARDLAEFEAATCEAFHSPAPDAPLTVHGRGILDDPAMHVLTARDRSGRVVSGAMGYVDDRVLGLYGVGTVPGHTGLGLATLVTTAALAVAPDRPAILQPSAEAAPLYRRLGFAEIGRFAHWGAASDG